MHPGGNLCSTEYTFVVFIQLNSSTCCRWVKSRKVRLKNSLTCSHIRAMGLFTQPLTIWAPLPTGLEIFHPTHGLQFCPLLRAPPPGTSFICAGLGNIAAHLPMYWKIFYKDTLVWWSSLTCLPKFCSCHAAASPDAPAPITITFFCKDRQGIQLQPGVILIGTDLQRYFAVF